MRLSLLTPALLIGCMVFHACESKHHDTEMETDIDSLSYAVGHLNGSELRNHLADYGIEEEYLDEVVKGFREGLEASGDKKQTAYYFGVLQGLSIIENTNERVFRKDSSKQISPSMLMEGIFDGINNRNKLSTNNVQEFVQRRVNEIEHAYNLRKFEDNKRRNEQFIADMQKAEDVGKLANGTLYKVIHSGKGESPSDTATVVYHEEVSTIDGQVVRSTFGSNKPNVKNLRDVPPLIRDAVSRMRNGATWEVYIPWKLTGIQKETESLKPFSALIYKIHILSFQTKKHNNQSSKQIEQ